MKNVLMVVVVVMVLALAYFWGIKSRDSRTATTAVTLPDARPQETDMRQAPMPETAPMSTRQPEPTELISLPALDDSDGVFKEELARLYDPTQLDHLFLFESFIRHVVVTIDNLTAAKLPQKFKITRLPEGKFLTRQDSDGKEYIDPGNYERYQPYVRFIETLDVEQIAGLYKKYRPLFQQAYAELGYPDRQFNDRLLVVIDHVLAAPEAQEPLRLMRPKVYYVYADQQLEALSAGQKIMVRIGQANAARIKSWLQRLRVALTRAG
jgi:hypothetical protein